MRKRSKPKAAPEKICVFVDGLTVEQCEEVAGPADTWPGRCHDVANLINKGLGLGLYLAYGAFHGRIHKESPLYREGCPWCRHGWLETYDDLPMIVDPTRWVFEAVPPYVYVGDNPRRGDILVEYDVGNDLTRLAIEINAAPPAHDPSRKQVPLRIRDRLALKLVYDLFRLPPSKLDLHQVAFLANLSRRTLGGAARAIYEAIIAAGQQALIPIDNRNYVLRQKPEDVDE